MNDKMTTCKACGGEIAKGINRCPHCGEDQRNFLMKHKILSIIIVIIIVGCIGCALGSGNSSKPNAANQITKSNSSVKSEDTASKPKQEDKKYDYAKFMKINMGMTYDQVKGIIGEGKEESSSGSGDDKTAIYIWKNSNGSNISVEVQDRKVINKIQEAVQTMDAKVTMEKYNKINNGMTYDQVKAVLGDGQLSTQSTLLNSKTEIYDWINADGSNMNITFEDGKVDTKTQYDLK